jgi:hypothetical protein
MVAVPALGTRDGLRNGALDPPLSSGAAASSAAEMAGEWRVLCGRRAGRRGAGCGGAVAMGWAWASVSRGPPAWASVSTITRADKPCRPWASVTVVGLNEEWGAEWAGVEGRLGRGGEAGLDGRQTRVWGEWGPVCSHLRVRATLGQHHWSSWIEGVPLSAPLLPRRAERVPCRDRACCLRARRSPPLTCGRWCVRHVLVRACAMRVWLRRSRVQRIKRNSNCSGTLYSVSSAAQCARCAARAHACATCGALTGHPSPSESRTV